MRFLIITHVLHKKKSNQWFGYAPYVNEMNIWLKYADNVEVVAPLVHGQPNKIEAAYNHSNIVFTQIPSIVFTTFSQIIKSTFRLPLICYKIFLACKKADHIHLRCPGSIGLLGCLVQILFPRKIKTAKYAGNWEPESKQPKSYKLQKWILSNTFFTKNMNVLVYGDWINQTKNIKPFFTATFKKNEIEYFEHRDYSKQLKFLFIGSLVGGKRPLLAIKLIEELYKQGKEISLDLYGEGILKTDLEDYVLKNDLASIVKFKGNQTKETIKGNLKKAHFLLLPSKSEGWPKALAEAMFFGVIPITTKVSCVPFMIDNGNRGILIEPELNRAIKKITEAIETRDLQRMSKLASEWSQCYTLEYFESEIKKLMLT